MELAPEQIRIVDEKFGNYLSIGAAFRNKQRQRAQGNRQKTGVIPIQKHLAPVKRAVAFPEIGLSETRPGMRVIAEISILPPEESPGQNSVSWVPQ